MYVTRLLLLLALVPVAWMLSVSPFCGVMKAPWRSVASPTTMLQLPVERSLTVAIGREVVLPRLRVSVTSTPPATCEQDAGSRVRP